MKQIINFEGEEYSVNIIFTNHALDRGNDRCVSESKVIRCIEKGFGYLLDDAEINWSCPHRMYSRLIHSSENFMVIAFSRWNAYETEINISIITVILDLFNPRHNRRNPKHTKTHTI